MKIRYEPEVPESGLQSFLHWNHPDLHQALLAAFNIQKHERLLSVEVNSQGLRAIIETRPICPGESR